MTDLRPRKPGRYFTHQWDPGPDVTAALRWRTPRLARLVGDPFADHTGDEELSELFAVMGIAAAHTFIVTTRNPARMCNLLARPAWREATQRQIRARLTEQQWNRLDTLTASFAAHGILRNLWLGVHAADQHQADAAIPYLLATPAAVRFVRIAEMAGPVDVLPYLSGNCPACGDDVAEPACGLLHARMHSDLSACGLNGVIVDGTGRGDGPAHPQWLRSLRDQCAGRAAFFFTGWGPWVPHRDAHRWCDPWTSGEVCWVGPDGAVHPFGDFAGPVEERQWALMQRVGRRNAGRALDGRIHSDLPTGRLCSRRPSGGGSPRAVHQTAGWRPAPPDHHDDHDQPGKAQHGGRGNAGLSETPHA